MPIHLTAQVIYDPAIPLPAIIALGIFLGAMALWVYLGKVTRMPIGKRAFLLFCRVMAIALICLLLLQPMREEIIPRKHPRRVALLAVDTSQSMAEKDAIDNVMRLDAARKLIAENGLTGNEKPDLGIVRRFSFDSEARPARKDLSDLKPDGDTTQMHESLSSVLDAAAKDEYCIGLFLFSDGHDFEMIPANRTAQIARTKGVPIFPVALGREDVIPDLSTYIVSYQPYTFVSQSVTIQAALRLTGGGLSNPAPVRVELLREGKLLRQRKVTPISGGELPIAFDVVEAKTGQYEYEIRVSPIQGEKEVANNGASTFLNVTDAKIPILMIEGAPHWDTTFMKRTLLGNERIEFTSIIKIGNTKPRIFSSDETILKEGKLPEIREDFQRFPLIILGREIENVIGKNGVEALGKAVSEGGNTLVFARGNPGDHEVFTNLAPATWIEGRATGPVRIVEGRSGDHVVPLDVLKGNPGGIDALPELPFAGVFEEPKTLSAIEALAQDTQLQNSSPAFIHRRAGKGQVMAVSVGGLWKWSLNASSEPDNNIYDRFWNQLLLNLLARSNIRPSDRSQLTVSSANVRVGENVRLNFIPKHGELIPTTPKASVYHKGKPIASLTFSPSGSQWTTDFVADRSGKFRVAMAADDGALNCRFAALNENRETTEVAADFAYLRRLADGSGGRLLNESTLSEVIAELSRAAVAESEAPPIVKHKTIWDRVSFFYLLFFLLGLEWFFRRRWGLV